MILDLYHYDIDDHNLQITTVLVPINNNGKVIGIVGIDIALETLKIQINKIRVYQTGYASLISNNNFYVTDKDKNVIGTAVKNPSILKTINIVKDKGDIQVNVDKYDNILKTRVYRIFVPIKFGNTKTPWVFMTTMAENRSLQKVGQITWLAILLSVFSIFLLAMVILFTINGIVNPLNSVINELTICSNQISILFNKMLVSSLQLSQGSAEQAAVIEESASTLSETSSTLEHNMDNTKQATELAELTADAAVKGNDYIQSMVDTMNEINRSSESYENNQDH